MNLTRFKFEEVNYIRNYASSLHPTRFFPPGTFMYYMVNYKVLRNTAMT